MQIEATALDGVKIITPRVHADDRGLFYESFNQALFNDAVGYSVDFRQDNHSRSVRGVIRGLHFQEAPFEQGKLVRVVSGAVFDVAVDIRVTSPTFGHWVAVELTSENFKQLWIPPGFAHGFMVLSDSAEVLYKTTDYWNKDAERSIVWNDQNLAVAWPGGIEPVLSQKDRLAPSFRQALGRSSLLKS